MSEYQEYSSEHTRNIKYLLLYGDRLTNNIDWFCLKRLQKKVVAIVFFFIMRCNTREETT